MTVGIADGKFLKLTENKKLYTLELAITKHPWEPGRHNEILYRLPFMIYAQGNWAKDGQWGTTYFGTSILGVSSGYWHIGKSSLDGPYLMTLYIEEPPSAVTVMWRDWPEACGLITAIPKFPLPLASSGRGSLKHSSSAKGSHWFTWRVAERRF